jgi:hypothetical protein
MVLDGATESIRLNGPIFSKKWDAGAIKSAFTLDRASLYMTRERPDPARAEECLVLMNERIASKAAYNKMRFSTVGRGSKKIYIEELVSGSENQPVHFIQTRETNLIAGESLGQEFKISPISATSNAGTSLPVICIDAVEELGVVDSFDNSQWLRKSHLDEVRGIAQGVFPRNGFDFLELETSRGTAGLQRPVNNKKELDDAQRAPRTWRSNDARRVVSRAIKRAAFTSRGRVAAAIRRSNEASSALGRALQAAERADRSLTKIGGRAGSPHEEFDQLLRESARRIAEAFADCSQLLRKRRQDLDQVLAPPAPIPAEVAYALADQALRSARAYRRAKIALREYKLGRDSRPTAEQMKLLELPPPRYTLEELVSARELAANFLDAESDLDDDLGSNEKEH